jgi:hypothetical protein
MPFDKRLSTHPCRYATNAALIAASEYNFPAMAVIIEGKCDKRYQRLRPAP